MNFEKVIANRDVREGRHARPYLNFREAADQCIAAGKDIVENDEQPCHQKLLERAVVITFVTHIEVYFRDMLDAIFRHCDPDYFLPQIKHIHKDKYTIEDLLYIFETGIHPLELVSSDMSFQNAEVIEKVFSKFLGSSLWGAAIGAEIRIKGKPETACSFEPEYLEGLKRVFKLRHELVHNPKNTAHLTSSVLEDIVNADGLMLAVDCVLSQMLHDHRDPSMDQDSQK